MASPASSSWAATAEGERRHHKREGPISSLTADAGVLARHYLLLISDAKTVYLMYGRIIHFYTISYSRLHAYSSFDGRNDAAIAPFMQYLIFQLVS